MVSSISGKNNANNRKNGGVRWLSPRFMPIMPDKIDSENEHLSPSVLSFYKDNKSIASLPEISKMT